MKKIMFYIIKLLISLVFQFGICFGSVMFAQYCMHYIYDSDIFYRMIVITFFLMGEVGVFLLYVMKPLEKKMLRIIYAIIYMGIHLTSIAFFWAYIFAYMFMNY